MSQNQDVPSSTEAAAAAAAADVLAEIRRQRDFRQLTSESEKSAVLELATVLQRDSTESTSSFSAPVAFFQDTSSLVRFLRARQWDVHKAAAMAHASAEWQESFDLRGVREGAYREQIASENAMGKLYVRGFDKRGRPAIYMKPRNESSTSEVGPVRHLAYCMERAIACLDRQLERGNLAGDINDVLSRKVVLLIDFSGCGLSNMPPLSVAKECILMLQDHFPERLGQAFIVDAPWVLSAFFNVVSAFVDPVTIEKFQFVTETGEERSQRMAKYFDLDTLEPEFGGNATVPFNSAIFLAESPDPFGMEFSQQLQLHGEGPLAASAAPAAEVSKIQEVEQDKASTWSIFSDPRVSILAWGQ